MSKQDLEPKESDPIEEAQKALEEYMKGAEIGSPKLLALSDELNSIKLCYYMTPIMESKSEIQVRTLLLLQMQTALLNIQINNRCVEVDGYAPCQYRLLHLVANLDYAYQGSDYSAIGFIDRLLKDLTIGAKPL